MSSAIDYDRLRRDELVSIGELLGDLRPEEWDAQSLCDGWRVRDVIGHMCVGYTTPMLPMLAKVARRGFNVPRASRDGSIAFGDSHRPVELTDTLQRIARDNVRLGIARVIKPAEGLVDHVIHHQDIRRPLGRPRAVPEERLVAALGVIPGLGGFVGSKRRVAGLTLVATNVPWSAGDGPVVQGPGEAILLAASGRAVTLGELDGDGLPTLRARLAA